MSEAERLLKAINSAAEKLPENWMVSIDIENGFGGVSLSNLKGDDIDSNDFTSPDDNLAEQLENAIAYAIANDGEQAQ